MTNAKPWLPLAITRKGQVLFYQGAQVSNEARPDGDGIKKWHYQYTANYIDEGDGTTLYLQLRGDGTNLDDAIAEAKERLDLQGWLPYVESAEVQKNA